MKISARNQLKGTIVEVKLGVITAEVVVNWMVVSRSRLLSQSMQ